jgi:hypothetical protein
MVLYLLAALDPLEYVHAECTLQQIRSTAGQEHHILQYGISMDNLLDGEIPPFTPPDSDVLHRPQVNYAHLVVTV